MNRQKNFIWKIFILILFLLSLIVSFYFALDWVLSDKFTNISNNQSSRATEIFNIATIDWWIGAFSILFGLIFIFLIFWIVIIILRVKDKKKLLFFNNNDQSYNDLMLQNNISIRTDTYILDELNYSNNVSYRTKEFVPYHNKLHDDYLRNNWWMKKS
ncbi:MAG: hypothetical protein ACRCUM_01540 [Mycoplasmoidaceae bacterium]